MTKIQFNNLSPKIVLGIGAHPDDLDFSSSGTLAKYAMEGAKVYYLILTDGSKGTADYQASPAELSKIRREEQKAALKIIKGKDASFLNYVDGELLVTNKLKKDLVKVIRTIKPDLVVTMDPSVLYSTNRGFINHPDHRAAGQATLDAVYPFARDHLAFPDLFEQGLTPHKVKTILLSNFDKQNFYVDITSTIDLKLKAIYAHASQVTDKDTTHEWVLSMASQIGHLAGYQYAEGFMRIDLKS